MNQYEIRGDIAVTLLTSALSRHQASTSERSYAAAGVGQTAAGGSQWRVRERRQPVLVAERRRLAAAPGICSCSANKPHQPLTN